MASRVINTILNLRNNFSRPIGQATRDARQFQRQTQHMSNSINRFGRDANKTFLNVTKTTAKFGLTTAGVVAGLAVKTGISEAMDLEGYKMQLETATKSTKKASDIMRYAVNLANKTPYEAGELVSGASKFEAMGLSAKKYLPLVGDMASATNKGVDQAVEALIDAQTGELERLKEFGITKAMIAKKGSEMFKKQQIINNKGQIVNQEKFNKALEKIMVEKFKGGMDKQSTTLKGTWSTVTGVTKSALAEMMGMTTSGTVRQGSMYDKLKKKITEIANTFAKWQSDGTLQKLGKTIETTVSKALNILGKTIKFVKDNFNWLAPVMTGIVATFITFNVITKVVGMYKALSSALTIATTAQGALNVVMALNPIGLVAIAVGLLVAGGILLWKNWTTVSKVMKSVWVNIKNTFATGVNFVIGKINWLIKKLNKIPGVKIPVIADVKMDNSLKDKSKPLNIKSNSMVKYAKGGIATKPSIFGEAGAEIAIPLNKSSRSKGLLNKANNLIGGGNGGVNVQITVQGNVIGNEDFADKITNIIVKKTKMALANC